MRRPRQLQSSLARQFALVAIAPLLAVGALLLLRFLPLVESEIESRNRTLANAAGTQAELFLQGPELLLHNLRGALQSARDRGADTETRSLLETAIDSSPLFEALYLVSGDGSVREVGLPAERRERRRDFLGLDLSSRAFVAETLARDHATWSDTFLSLFSGEISLALALPVGEEALVGDFRIERLSEFARRLQAEGQGLPMIIDRKGQLIAHPSAALSAQQLNLSHITAVREALDGRPGAGRFAFEGRDYLGAAMPIEGPHWVALVGVEVGSAYHDIREAAWILLAGLLGATALALVTALLGARHFARPFREFAALARELSAGRYELNPPRSRIKEIQDLSRVFAGMVNAIEEREQQIAASERKYRELVEGTENLITRVDAQGRFTFVNSAARRVFGLAPDECLGLSAFDFIHPEDREFTRRSFERWRERGESSATIENRQVSRTGRIHHMLWTVHIERGGPDEVNGFSSIARDITERRLVEAANARLAAAVDALSERFALYDADDRFVLCNAKFRELNAAVADTLRPGVSFEDHLRAVLDQGLVPDARGREEAWLVERLARHRYPSGPFELSRQDGLYLLVYEQRLPDGSTVTLSTDVTELRRQTGEINQLRHLLANIIDSMPSVLVGVDAEGLVTQWNREAERFSGLGTEQALGRPLATVLPQLGGESERVQAAISTRTPQRDPKLTLTGDGEIRYAEVTIYPLDGEHAEGAVIRMDDITERLRLEEVMIQSEKMLSVGGLAAGMAHEINNPLAGILQSVQVLRNRLDPDLAKNAAAAREAGTSMEAIAAYAEKRELPRMIEGVLSSGQRAARIVENMLSFARKSTARLEEHDLAALLERTLELAENDYDLKKKHDFRRIKIVRDFEAGMPPVRCEPAMLQQVFLNILRNGAEAMAGYCPHHARTPCFTLAVRRDGDWARVEIRDNGPGMDEAERRRLFEPFYTTKEVGVGTGLGLSVSYFIICETHGGLLDVIAEPGAGACFVIRLPLRQSQPAGRVRGDGTGGSRAPRPETNPT